MDMRDESEGGLRNEEDEGLLEDVQDVNSHSSNHGDLGDSMLEDNWVMVVDDGYKVMAETGASSISVLDGSNQMSQPKMTEGAVGGSQQRSQPQTAAGAVGGCQQSETTEGAVGESQQRSQPQTAAGAVGGCQQSETTKGAVGESQQRSQPQTAAGAVGGCQQSETTEGAVGEFQQRSQPQTAAGAVGGCQQLETTEGAVGEFQQKSQPQMAAGAVGDCQQLETIESDGEVSELPSLMSEGAVGGRQGISLPAESVLPPLHERYLHLPTDPSEELHQSKFISQMTAYEGAPVAPNESFELQWTVYRDELNGYLTHGLLPQDTVASAGIDEESYKQMQQCSEVLQDQLYEGNLLLCLGNLRGFRRIFSRSKDPYLRHAFRGDPLEVLQNIYYGGEGILPEERMLLDDPFHYTKNPDDLDC